MNDHDMLVRLDERMRHLEGEVRAYRDDIKKAANNVILTRIGQAAILVLL